MMDCLNPHTAGGRRSICVRSVEGEEVCWSLAAAAAAVTLTGCIDSCVETAGGGAAVFATPTSAQVLRTLAAFGQHAAEAAASGAPPGGEADASTLGARECSFAELAQLLQGAHYLEMPAACRVLSVELCARLHAVQGPRELHAMLEVACDLSDEEARLASTESIFEPAAADGTALPLAPQLAVDDDAIEEAIKTALAEDITASIPMLCQLKRVSRGWRAVSRRILCEQLCFGCTAVVTDIELQPFLHTAGPGLAHVAEAMSRFRSMARMHAKPFVVDVADVRDLGAPVIFSLERDRPPLNVMAPVRRCIRGEGEPPYELLLAVHALRYGRLHDFCVPEGAFCGNRALTSIKLPAGFTSIARRAFQGCSSLLSIELPVGLTSIGVHAFKDCASLLSIDLPVGLTSIGVHAFKDCTSLSTIDLPAGLLSIGVGAFYGCTSLASIDLPVGLTSIGAHAFVDCASLSSIELRGNLTRIDGVAFYGCTSLASIKLPPNLTSIGARAFEGCSSLVSIGLHDGLTSLGGHAFHVCSSLASIELPIGLTGLDDHTFAGCTSLASVTLPAGLKSIGSFAFYGCTSLGSIHLPASLCFIGASAFMGCTSLESINMPDGLLSIGDCTFKGCTSLVSICLPAFLTSVDTSTFSDCTSLVAIDLPAGLMSIGYYAFNQCSSLESIDLPASLKSIGNCAFKGCQSLKSVELPAGLRSIGAHLFVGCTSLTPTDLATRRSRRSFRSAANQ